MWWKLAAGAAAGLVVGHFVVPGYWLWLVVGVVAGYWRKRSTGAGKAGPSPPGTEKRDGAPLRRSVAHRPEQAAGKAP